MQEYNFKQIESENFTNFYRLNDSVYRSEQPSKKGMKELEAMGIKSILNLRRQKTDEKKIKGLNLQLNRIPLKAATIDFDDIFNALRSMQQAEKPVEFAFQQVDANTLRLQFGASCIELSLDGNISIKNTQSEISLNAEGEVKVQGKHVQQNSEQHIQLDAKQNIYLNSR